MTLIQIVHRISRDAVKEIDVTGKTERQIDKIKSGISINLNHDMYFIQTKEIKEEIKCQN